MDQAQVTPGQRGWQYYWNPWWREKHTYFTHLNATDCRRLLSETTTRFLLGRSVGRKLFSSADFTLYRVTLYANGLKPYFYVRLNEPIGGGTLVSVTVSALAAARVFWAVWFGFIAFWTLLASTAMFTPGVSSLMAPPIGIGMAAFGILLNAFGRTLARGDAAFLLRFLNEQLGLTDPPPGSVASA